MTVKIMKASQNGGIWSKDQGHESISFYHRKCTSSLWTVSFDIFRMKVGSAVYFILFIVGSIRVKKERA